MYKNIMLEQVLMSIIDEGESSITEFKASFQKEVIETVVAFANTRGCINNGSGGVNDTLGGVNSENGGVNELLIYVQNNPGKKSKEIAEGCHKSLRTIERQLKQLKDEGRIEFKGAPKNGGYFVK